MNKGSGPGPTKRPKPLKHKPDSHEPEKKPSAFKRTLSLLKSYYIFTICGFLFTAFITNKQFEFVTIVDVTGPEIRIKGDRHGLTTNTPYDYQANLAYDIGGYEPTQEDVWSWTLSRIEGNNKFPEPINVDNTKKNISIRFDTVGKYIITAHYKIDNQGTDFIKKEKTVRVVHKKIEESAIHKKPKASFTINGEQVKEIEIFTEERLTIVSNSKDFDKLTWDFDGLKHQLDRNNERATVSSHTPGNYILKLTAYRENKSLSDEKRVMVKIKKPGDAPPPPEEIIERLEQLLTQFVNLNTDESVERQNIQNELISLAQSKEFTIEGIPIKSYLNQLKMTQNPNTISRVTAEGVKFNIANKITSVKSISVTDEKTP